MAPDALGGRGEGRGGEGRGRGGEGRRRGEGRGEGRRNEIVSQYIMQHNPCSMLGGGGGGGQHNGGRGT